MRAAHIVREAVHDQPHPGYSPAEGADPCRRGGTLLATQACTWSTTLLIYQCNIKAPSTVLKGKNAPPYYLTVFQRVPNGTGTWFLMPNGTGAKNTNSEQVFFK